MSDTSEDSRYFFTGTGFCAAGTLGIVGVCASFPKKLDPEGACLATLILLAILEYALSAGIAGRMEGGFATGVLDVCTGAAGGAAGTVDFADSVDAAGLSDFILILDSAQLRCTVSFHCLSRVLFY